MPKKILLLFKPRTFIDIIGVILIVWTLFPMFVPPSRLTSDFSDSILSLPITVFTKYLIPLPEGLGALGVVMFNVFLLLVIINITVLILNKYVLKKNSFSLIFVTLLVVFLSIGTTKIYSIRSSKQYVVKMSERRSSMDMVKIEVLSCVLGEVKKDTYDLVCGLKLSNLPQGINNTTSIYEINLASDEHFKFAPKELEEQMRKPGIDGEYFVSVYNHILGMGSFSDIEEIGENSVVGSFFTIVPKNISPETLYIVSLDIHDKFDKYFSNPRKDFLFDQ